MAEKNEKDGPGGELELIDLEKHAKDHGDGAPAAKKYQFRVDRDKVVVDVAKLNGRQILGEVNKTPEEFKLYQHKRGNQPLLIGPDTIVDLREPGVERFTTMPKDTTEGREDGPCIRADFQLPVSDEEYLNGLGRSWEAILDGASRWLVIHKWRLPSGYNVESTNLALLIPGNYSDSQIDMVYFNDHLARTDGVAIGALSTETICGTLWQRWSRHRTAANPWRPNTDDVASHLTLVDEWLRREFEKK